MNLRTKARLASYVFVAPPRGGIVHMNQTNNTLQLQADLSCEEICRAVETWMSAVSGQGDIQSRIAALPKIVVWGSSAHV